MINLRIRTTSALTVVVAAMILAAPAPTQAQAQPAMMSISGGTAVNSIPQGTSGNSVLGQAGIGFAGGQIWVDGTLDILSDTATLTLRDVGSESYAKNQIRMANTSGSTLADTDNFYKGSTGNFTNGPPPFQLVGSVVQGSGVAQMEFWRTESNPPVRIVVNGQSPMMMASGSGYASIALAYLNDTYQIVSEPTNRILVLLEDSGGDRDYDDYVGILEVSATAPVPAQPAMMSISGGTAVNSIPQGTSGNSVLGQAGIGFAGGQIWVDGTLDILSDTATLTLRDVGSESHWMNQIRLANTSGSTLQDYDDHWRGSTGNFTNGPPPFQLVGSVIQRSGVAQMEFWRVDSDPPVQIVVNGQSPMMMVSGYGYASIALAYLNDTYQIVSVPTNRILVLLEDGGKDRDYDDYVGILEASSTATATAMP